MNYNKINSNNNFNISHPAKNFPSKPKNCPKFYSKIPIKNNSTVPAKKRKRFLDP